MDQREEPIRLTQFSHGSGCGCKIAPEVLEKVLQGVHTQLRPDNLLVGNDARDDAAVMDLGNGFALISTTDFFTPIVDDPKTFGRIAAANALSDIYAMGGTPKLALAILGWPVDKLPAEMAAQVVDGGRSICEEFEVPLAGGHSIDSPEPFFGLAVTGMVQKEHLKRNDTAQLGNILYLTKPLGTGIMSTALKRGKIRERSMGRVFEQMEHVNSIGSAIGNLKSVHAMTDVTGFGLLGHLLEMAEGSGLSAEIFNEDVPLMHGVLDLAHAYCIPDNTYRNFKSYEDRVSKLETDALHLLCDPQTNGGLLIAVDPNGREELEKLLQENGEPCLRIGKMIQKEEKGVVVR
ncbi:MAG: selenide, water dikinase SelD [Bacteroidota bacterium]|nr:selenide, water dikinase SelD [Bacteroidota bacterium]